MGLVGMQMSEREKEVEEELVEPVEEVVESEEGQPQAAVFGADGSFTPAPESGMNLGGLNVNSSSVPVTHKKSEGSSTPTPDMKLGGLKVGSPVVTATPKKSEGSPAKSEFKLGGLKVGPPTVPEEPEVSKPPVQPVKAPDLSKKESPKYCTVKVDQVSSELLMLWYWTEDGKPRSHKSKPPSKVDCNTTLCVGVIWDEDTILTACPDDYSGLLPIENKKGINSNGRIITIGDQSSITIKARRVKKEDIISEVMESPEDFGGLPELEEGYNPYRRGLKPNVVNKMIKSASRLQLFCDCHTYATTRTGVGGAIGSAWKSTVGRVVKTGPLDYLQGKSAERCIDDYSSCTELSELSEQLQKDVAKMDSKVDAGDIKARPKNFITPSKGSIAVSAILLFCLSRNSGCVGVKFNTNVEEMDVTWTVKLKSFYEVYCLFKEQGDCYRFASYLNGVVPVEVVNIRERAGEKLDSGIQGLALSLSGTTAGMCAGTQMDRMAAEGQDVGDGAFSFDEFKDSARKESSRRQQKSEELAGSLEDYNPFKKGMDTVAYQSLLDARAYQIYEDNKIASGGTKTGKAIKVGSKVLGTAGKVALKAGVKVLSVLGAGLGTLGRKFSKGSGYSSYTSNSGYRDGYNGRRDPYSSGREEQNPRAQQGLYDNFRDKKMQDSFIDCNDLDKFLKKQTKVMKGIPKGKLRRIRNGTAVSDGHIFNVASIMAYKMLQFSLSRKSGVKEVLLGGSSGNSSRYPTVTFGAFAELYCSFIDQEHAVAFCKFMEDYFEDALEISYGSGSYGGARNYGSNPYGSSGGYSYQGNGRLGGMRL